MKYLIAAALFLCAGPLRSQSRSTLDSDSLIASGAEPVKVSSQFSFTEGAAVDHRGNVYFTDQPNNKIWKYGVDGKLSLFMDSAGRSNGMYVDRSGNLVTCADEKDQLWSIAPNKAVTVLTDNFGGHRFNGPNDLWIMREGGIYFTDPYYQRDYWTRTKPDLDGQRVYFLAKGQSQAIVVADSLKQPNGIVGTPDGKILYIADIGDGKTYKYRIQKDGSLRSRELFIPQGSDGMTLDERGNLYLTGDGVTVYDPAGGKIAHIPIPEKWTANLCFGGKDKRTLFITASGSIYTLRMNVRGVE